MTLAVVTGATGGLGSACARALASDGARVVLISRSAAALDALAAELGGGALAVPCDVTDAGALRAAFAGFDPPDAVVTCVGGNWPEPYVDVSVERLEWSWRVNVRSAFLTGQAAVRRMLAAGRNGRIVHVTSQMGHVGGLDRSAYCAAKHAVEGLTKATAIELAPHGIRVNAVAPTFVETPMTRPYLDEPATREGVLARIPSGRLGTAGEVAEAVRFAASPACELMTGASLVVDGGWTAQ